MPEGQQRDPYNCQGNYEVQDIITCSRLHVIDRSSVRSLRNNRHCTGDPAALDFPY
jgi:hypothetical protein